MFRAIAARANFMAQDRSDVAFAVKELCRRMSKPTQHDMQHLKRLGRYLVNSPRAVCLFEYQAYKNCVGVWSDTDYAGCIETRKSSTGTIVTFGRHVLKASSATQAIIALSSGEAEYYGLVKGGIHWFGHSGNAG